MQDQELYPGWEAPGDARHIQSAVASVVIGGVMSIGGVAAKWMLRNTVRRNDASATFQWLFIALVLTTGPLFYWRGMEQSADFAVAAALRMFSLIIMTQHRPSRGPFRPRLCRFHHTVMDEVVLMVGWLGFGWFCLALLLQQAGGTYGTRTS